MLPLWLAVTGTSPVPERQALSSPTTAQLFVTINIAKRTEIPSIDTSQADKALIAVC